MRHALVHEARAVRFRDGREKAVCNVGHGFAHLGICIIDGKYKIREVSVRGEYFVPGICNLRRAVPDCTVNIEYNIADHRCPFAFTALFLTIIVKVSGKRKKLLVI